VLAIVGGRRTAGMAGLVVISGLLVGLLGAFSLLPVALTDRLQTIGNNLRIFDAGQVSVTPENFAIVERMAHWQAGWRMFQTYPIFGVGAGNFNVAYPEFFIAPWATSQGHAHNYYIHTVAESGIFGLLSYLLLVGMMLREALRVHAQLPGTVWGMAAAGVCGIIAAVAGHNIFENLHVLNMGIQLSGVWALSIISQRWAGED
jgi:O-antigen ligase